MTSRSRSKRTWLLLLTLLGLSSVYVYFFFLPGQQEIEELQLELAQAESQAAGTVQMVATMSEIQKRLGTVSEYTEAWEQAAPSEDELSEVFERIYELTRLAETETTRFEPHRAIAYETFLRVPVSMECEGSFAQLAAVLTGLEAMREPIWLTSIEIRPFGKNGEAARAEINLDILADNLGDSDQDNLSGSPITLETDSISARL